jgi:hypothetical protein
MPVTRAELELIPALGGKVLSKVMRTPEGGSPV